MNDKLISEDDLHAYVDEALSAGRRVQVADYLQEHPEVAARVRDYQNQRENLRAAFGAVADEPLPVELNLSRIMAARRGHGKALWQAAAACALIFLSGSGGWWLHGLTTQGDAPASGIASLAQEASDTYRVYASDPLRPVEIKASDSAQLVSWASQRMKAPVLVPNLSAAGFNLMGGRLVATPHGPAVMIMYDNNLGARLALLSRPMDIDKNRRMALHSDKGVSGYAWSDKGMGYDLMGPVAAANLHPLADEARRQILQNLT